jgi:hypothetical protein
VERIRNTAWKRSQQKIDEDHEAFSVSDTSIFDVSCPEECACQSAKAAGARFAVVAAAAAEPTQNHVNCG